MNISKGNKLERDAQKQLDFVSKWKSDFVPRTYSKFESDFDFNFVCKTKSLKIYIDTCHPHEIISYAPDLCNHNPKAMHICIIR